MKYLLMIDGFMAIVPYADNERVIMHLKEFLIETPNRWIFPTVFAIPSHLTEVTSVVHGRVRFTTSKDDYEFFSHFFNGVDCVLNLEGNK